MILLEEDIQQLRIIKTKGTGEQTFNLFSTSIAAFKGVSWQNIKSKTIFNTACCLYIAFQNYAMWDNNLQTLPLFYSTAWRDPQLERGGCLVGKGGGREGEGGQSKRLQVSAIKHLHSHILVYKSQEAGKREGDTREIRFFLLYLSPPPLFFFRRFIISGFHHFV